MDSHCVMCGAYLADTGRMVCEKCEKQQTELKPCPFCGGEAKLGWYRDFYYIRCKNCGIRTLVEFTMRRAIEAWNRRAEDGT